MDWLPIIGPGLSAFVGALVALGVVKTDVANVKKEISNLREDHKETVKTIHGHIMDHAKGVYREP